MSAVLNATSYGMNPTASGTTNSAALQSALNDLKTSSNKLVIEPGHYAMQGGVELIETVQNAQNQVWIIDGQGATLDWSQSGITAGALFQIGSSSMTTVHERGFIVFENLKIIGPELDTPYVAHASEFYPSQGPATSCTGLYLSYALNVRLNNVMIRKCWNGLIQNWVWGFSSSNLFVRDCWNGIRLTSMCTQGTWNHTEVVQGDCGVLMQANVPGDVIHAQSFFGLRLEGLWRGMHMDPLDTPAGENQKATIRGITVIGMRSEAVYYDTIKARSSFPGNPGGNTWQTTNLVNNITIIGGEWQKPRDTNSLAIKAIDCEGWDIAIGVQSESNVSGLIEPKRVFVMPGYID